MSLLSRTSPFHVLIIVGGKEDGEYFQKLLLHNKHNKKAIPAWSPSAAWLVFYCYGQRYFQLDSVDTMLVFFAELNGSERDRSNQPKPFHNCCLHPASAALGLLSDSSRGECWFFMVRVREGAFCAIKHQYKLQNMRKKMRSFPSISLVRAPSRCYENYKVEVKSWHVDNEKNRNWNVFFICEGSCWWLAAAASAVEREISVFGEMRVKTDFNCNYVRKRKVRGD